MSRLLARAVVVSVVAAIALTQLDNEQELLAWEILLLGIVIWEMRGIPGGRFGDDPPLFDLSPVEPRRLPRAISSSELSVIDAISGYLGPDRRLQPALLRIAMHRLHRQGMELDSPAAALALGESEWSWLASPTSEAPSADMLDRVVSSLERL